MQRKQLINQCVTRIRKTSTIIIEGGRQWIFPQMCAMCRRLRTEAATMDGVQGMLCPLCESKGFDLAGPLDRVLPDGLQGVHAGFPFVRDGPLQGMLHALKYQIRPDVGEQLGRMLAIHRLASWLEDSNVDPTDVDPTDVDPTDVDPTDVDPTDVDPTDVDPTDCLLIPVPIHWKRRLGRGYNQSETIAQGIQAVFPGMEILPRGVFVRTRATQTQTRYSEEKRARNIRGAMAVSQHADMVERLNTLAVKRPVWILVDDVFTSGATLFECSSVLHEWVGRSDSLVKGHVIALHAWVVANAEDGM